MDSEDLTVEYLETAEERSIVYQAGAKCVEIISPKRGYGMLVVHIPGQGEVERYYGLDMAIDHVAELLGRSPGSIPVPDAASDLGI